MVNTLTSSSVQGIGLRVLMPPGTSFVKSSVSPPLVARVGKKTSSLPSKPYLNGSQLTWQNAPLAAGARRTFTVYYRITSDAPSGTQLTWQSFIYQTAVANVPYW
jgi:hypothetical protein